MRRRGGKAAGRIAQSRETVSPFKWNIFPAKSSFYRTAKKRLAARG
jgi:hypothetical protein